MKKFLIIAAALSTIAFAAPASAAPWQNINARQERLDNRIDQGVRNGRLTRAEAVQLRADFRQIASLETRYRRSSGLNMNERRDLDRRFDRLSTQLQHQLNDRQQRSNR
jgi:transposase